MALVVFMFQVNLRDLGLCPPGPATPPAAPAPIPPPPPPLVTLASASLNTKHTINHTVLNTCQLPRKFDSIKCNNI